SRDWSSDVCSSDLGAVLRDADLGGDRRGGLHGALSGQGVLYATLGVRQRPRAASPRATGPRRASISRASARGRTRRWQARTWRSISSAVAPWFRYSATARANVRTGRSPRLLLQRTQAVTRFAGSFVPPLLWGRTWSSASCAPSSTEWPHQAQASPSRR